MTIIFEKCYNMLINVRSALQYVRFLTVLFYSCQEVLIVTNERRASFRLPQDAVSDIPPDCIYLNDNQSCSILRTQRCDGESCSFRRTHEQSDLSNKAVVKMLNSLSAEQQKKIASSYYGGKMPWRACDKSSK